MLLSGVVQVLLFAILIGAVFIHAILSRSLQKSLIDPVFELKESTPTGIRIMGGLSLVYAGMLIVGYIQFLASHDQAVALLAEQMKQLPERDRQVVTLEMLSSVTDTMMAIFAVSGVITVINILLSYKFLNDWRDREEPETDIDIEN